LKVWSKEQDLGPSCVAFVGSNPTLPVRRFFAPNLQKQTQLSANATTPMFHASRKDAVSNRNGKVLTKTQMLF
jgi:hypothetical protein